MQPTPADAIAAATSLSEPFSPLRSYFEANFAALRAAWELEVPDWQALARWVQANQLHGRRGPASPKAAREAWHRTVAARRVP